MGYIKKLKNNELVGGTDKTTIYPVTSAEAVFEEVIEDGESNFKSQKFLNNNITGDRINEGTITDYNIAVGTVTKGKLTPQVQTMLDEGQKKALTPKGNYNSETEYEALDLVFDPVTNSSYISLVTPNVGHPVDENAEGYEEGWWEKTLDGTAVNTAQAAIDAKVGQLETQVGTAITQAETAVDEAKQETLNAYTQAEALAQQITDWSSSEISSTPSYADQHPLSNRASSAQVGYFECGTSSTTQASNQIKAVTAGGYALPTSGGAVKIKMYAANTYTPTTDNPVKLQFNADATTLKELRYNGEAVSPDNTWEDGEVLSVFYDGTRFMASNAQGGRKKKDTLSFAINGAGNTYVTVSDYNQFVKVGNTYRLWVKNTDVSMDGISSLAKTATRLSIIFKEADGTIIEEMKLASWQESLSDYYDFTVPEDCDKISVGGRCAVGSTLRLVLEDTTISEYIIPRLTNKIPFKVIEGKGIIYDGSEEPNNNRNCTDYIDISSMSSIVYTREVTDGLGGFGMAFYDENKDPLLWHGGLKYRPLVGYTIDRIDVPEGAVYARFTYWKDEIYGQFFFADGDRDAEAFTLWQSKKNSDILTGYEAGIYRQTIGITDNGFQLNSLYGLGSMIPVAKGDTVLWHYGNVEIRTMALCVYDEEGQYISFYNNTGAFERNITNFMSSGELSQYYVRASMLIANGSDNYVEVNGVRVWTAFNESLGNKFNKVDKVVEPLANLSFYNKSINASTGYEDDSTKRLSTSFIVHRGRYILSVADGYLIHSVNYYDENKTWYKGIYAPAQTVITEQQDIEGYIKIVVTNQDNTTDIALDAPINLTFNTYSGGSLDEFNDALRIGTFNSSYNNVDVEAVKQKFCALLDGKNNIENFLLFSDPHLSANSRYENITEGVRDKYISTLQKYYNSLPLDNCICAGDLLNYHDTNAEGLDELGYYDGYMRKLFRNYRPCMGNHDTAPYNTSSNYRNTTLLHNDVRNTLFREEKNTYYSFDGINTKFYVLNSGSSYIKTMTSTSEPTINNIRWTQVDWYANKLLTDDADFSIIMMHMYSNGTPLTWYNESTAKASAGIFPFSKHIREVAIAYNNRASITKNGITYDFSSCTGKVMMLICGHSHFDFIDDSMELPVVCITNLEGGVWDATSEQITYSLIPTFDCCMMDIDNSALYMTRVGAGVSRIVNYSPKALSVGGSISLTCKLSGTITWQARNSNIVIVSNGNVAGVSSGCTGIIATNESGEEEYWIVKVG